MADAKASSRKPDTESRLSNDLSSISLRSLLNALPEAVVMVDASGHVISFNAAAQSLFGDELTTSVEQPWALKGLYEQDRKTPVPSEQSPLGQALRGMTTDNVTLWIGSGSLVAITARPLWSEKRECAGAILTARQMAITDGSPTADFAGTNHFLAALVESSDDAIIGQTLNGVITSWNRGAQGMFGYTAKEAIGQPVSILYMPEHAEELSSMLDRVTSGRKVEHHETVRRHKNGSPIAVSLTISPVRDETGNMIGLSKIVRDITQTKNLMARERIAREETQTERRFRRLLEAAPDAILEVDTHGKIVLLNEFAEQMFGYSRSELMGMNVDALVPAGMRGEHAHHRAAYASRPQVRPMGTGLQLKAQRKDGTLFPVEISLSPNPGQDGLRVIALVRDVSARKEVENRLQAAREQHSLELAVKNEQLEARNRDVERANRLKSEFLASMSHELRTPLHTIIGFSELLTEELEGPLNPKQKRFMGHILQDSRHLLDLINEILDLSKIEAGRIELQPERFDFSSCLAEVISGIQQQAAAKKVLMEDHNTFHGAIFADRLRIKEILYNLLSNALKFTPEGGKVWVDGFVQDHRLHVTIADTGMGVHPQEHQSIFEKFYQVGSTTKGVREGTGLGLSITKKLIELHRGKIWIESEPGQGSRFTFTLPLIDSNQT